MFFKKNLLLSGSIFHQTIDSIFSKSFMNYLMIQIFIDNFFLSEMTNLSSFFYPNFQENILFRHLTMYVDMLLNIKIFRTSWFDWRITANFTDLWQTYLWQYLHSFILSFKNKVFELKFFMRQQFISKKICEYM